MDWITLRSYTDKNIALSNLVTLLKQGSLSLYLGAGVSISSGQFPGWVDLVRYCLKARGITKNIKDDEPIDSLLNAMDSVRRSFNDDVCAYKDLVRTFLSDKFTLDFSHAQNLLLIAIGSLVMPSKRGSVREIVTYNFDDLLEWYLGLHGHDLQVVTSLPFLYEEKDVTIYHPHGFLPKSSKYTMSEHFVFDQFSYDMTIGNEASPWYATCKRNLLQKVALMVGLSGQDPAIRTLVARTFDELKREKQTRPVSFLLNHKDSFGEEDGWFLERGIIPLRFNSFDEVWEFILRVCQKASAV